MDTIKTLTINIKDKMEENKNKNQKIENQANYNRLSLKTISIFENDAQTIFIFKKTEKLASAIYLITSFISDSEPLKWKVREVATRLLSYSMNLSNQGHRYRFDAMNNFLSASLEIISLLEVANISGIVSPMNYGILKFEMERVVELVDLKERSLNSKFLLSKNFFETIGANSAVAGRQEENHQTFGPKDNKTLSNQSANKQELKSQEYSKGHYNGQELIKDNHREIKDKVQSDKGQISKSDRYEVIINLLKNSKDITVKDVSGIISDCSEKTLQRELLSLVDKGVLKKEGERRWSKYSLA